MLLAAARERTALRAVYVWQRPFLRGRCLSTKNNHFDLPSTAVRLPFK